MNFTETFLTTTKLFCSIPEQQKPINEYIQNKETIGINWIFLKNINLLKKLVSFYFFLFFFFFISDLNFEKITKSSIIIATKNSYLISWFFFISFLSILFYRWYLLKETFQTSRLFYEEISWFDGQIWQKPSFLIKTDHLINELKIIVLLKRVFQVFCYTFFFFFFLSFIYSLFLFF